MTRITVRNGRRVIVSSLDEMALIDLANKTVLVALRIYQITPEPEKPTVSQMLGFLVAELTALIFGLSAEAFHDRVVRDRYQHALHTNCHSLLRLWRENKLTIPVNFPYTVAELTDYLQKEDTHD